MANYPQLDDARGVWKLHEVYDAVMGGYWPNYASKGLSAGGGSPADSTQIEQIIFSTAGNSTLF